MLVLSLILRGKASLSVYKHSIIRKEKLMFRTVKVFLQTSTGLYVISENNFPSQWVIVLQVAMSFMHTYF